MINSGDYGFFEGAEKLLQVCYEIPQGCSLRSIERSIWDLILDLVGAKIVDLSSTDYVDSYVLSESSLFVWDDKIVIKTCGATTLLPSYPEIQRAVQNKFPHSLVKRAFYSHKGFLRGHEQHYPHQSIRTEYRFLKKIFPGGKINNFEFCKEDISKWMIYTYFNPECQEKNLDSENSSEIRVELMMYDLDETRFEMFAKDFYINPDVEMREFTKITKILHNASINDKVFDPFGYSANGVKDDTYFTIHVTPQPSCSYASFEINQQSPELITSCLSCLEIFRPKNFCLAIVCHESAIENPLSLLSTLKERMNCKKTSSTLISNYFICYAWF